MKISASYFYPRPPRGGRQSPEKSTGMTRVFLSTSSARRTTASYCACDIFPCAFLSTSSARRTTTYPQTSCSIWSIFLSTSSARRTTQVLLSGVMGKCISIHVLREEDDVGLIGSIFAPKSFLSTSSARRTTGEAAQVMPTYTHFYPRPPRGGRRHQAAGDRKPHFISIHVLREEDDWFSCQRIEHISYFYPRPPRGGRPPALHSAFPP